MGLSTFFADKTVVFFVAVCYDGHNEKGKQGIYMNVKSKALRVLGTIGGVLFSIVLIFALIGSLVFSVSTVLVEPETIVTIVKEINLAEQVLSDESVKQALEQEGIQAEMITELLDSPFFEDTVEVYTNEVIAALQGEIPEVTLTEDVVRQFADEHMDSLITLTKKYIPESADLTDGQIKGAIDNLVNEYGSTLVEALPTGQQVQEMLVETEIQKPAELLVSTTVPIVLYSVIGVLAAIIFVCLLHKFRGLLCLGIDALIVAAILLAPYLVLTNDALITSLLADSASLVAPLIAVFSTRLGTYLIVLTVVGVLLIAGYITNTVLTKKKAAVAIVEGEVIEPLPEATEALEAIETTEVIEATEPAPTEEI